MWRAYENRLFWCLISTSYMYQNLEFSWARSNMCKSNVTFAWVFSWGFWILRKWKFSWELWILVHIWRAYENPLFWCLISTPYVYQNLKLSWSRSNMYKNNVSFAWLFSWGFWIWRKGTFSWVFWIFLHIGRTCLWESPILVSHKHAIYVLKSRILMSTLKYVQT